MTRGGTRRGAGDEVLPAGFHRGTAPAGGTQLSYLLGGSGPLVVLLHGWPQTSAAWLPVLQPLAQRGYTVLAPDLRGTGRSARAAVGYAKDDQAEDVRALARHLRVGPQAVVVGHDIGGMVAFSWARRHPGEVANLVLVDLAVPGLGLEEAMDVAKGGMWHFGFFMQPQVPEMLVSGHEPEFFAWWFTQQGGGPGSVPADIIQTNTRAYTGVESLRGGFEHYRTLLEDGKVNRAWVDAGGTLSMPVLAVGGERSAGTRVADSLRTVAPQVQALSIDGAGHFVAEQQPQLFLRALDRFLGTGSAAQPHQQRDRPSTAPQAGST